MQNKRTQTDRQFNKGHRRRRYKHARLKGSRQTKQNETQHTGQTTIKITNTETKLRREFCTRTGDKQTQLTGEIEKEHKRG